MLTILPFFMWLAGFMVGIGIGVNIGKNKK
jgi:hypothetical protein